jgi:hypothetical protein
MHGTQQPFTRLQCFAQMERAHDLHFFFDVAHHMHSAVLLNSGARLLQTTQANAGESGLRIRSGFASCHADLLFDHPVLRWTTGRIDIVTGIATAAQAPPARPNALTKRRNLGEKEPAPWVARGVGGLGLLVGVVLR